MLIIFGCKNGEKIDVFVTYVFTNVYKQQRMPQVMKNIGHCNRI